MTWRPGTAQPSGGTPRRHRTSDGRPAPSSPQRAHPPPALLWQPLSRGIQAHPQCASAGAFPLPSRLTVPGAGEAQGRLAWWLGAHQVLLLPSTRCVLHPGCPSVLRVGVVAAPQMVAVRQTKFAECWDRGRPSGALRKQMSDCAVPLPGRVCLSGAVLWGGRLPPTRGLPFRSWAPPCALCPPPPRRAPAWERKVGSSGLREDVPWGSASALPTGQSPLTAAGHRLPLAEGPADTWGLCYWGRWGDRSWETIRFSQSVKHKDATS